MSRLRKRLLTGLKKKKIHAEILKPFREPMVVKPKEWELNPYSGGYYIKDLRPAELGTTLGDLNNQSTQTNEVKNELSNS